MRKNLSLVLYVLVFSVIGTRSYGQALINTIAGSGTAGYSGDGGMAVNAQVNNPFGVALDASGNVYIADAANNCIRMLNMTTGIISTIAGNGTAGATGDGGLAIAAELNNPTGVAVDAAGNVYVADQANNKVRKIAVATGVITTIAGNGTAGYSGDGAAAASAELSSPYSVALDAGDNVYIADAGNNRIREINVSTGNISSVAGSTAVGGFGGDGGLATVATLNHPMGVALDASGNIYIADTYNGRIREVNIGSGKISTVAGNGTTAFVAGLATATGLNLPTGVALDASSNIYIADANNNLVEMVTISSGDIAAVAGTGTAGYNGDCITPTTSEVNNATGVAVDASGNIYIADSGNQRIREIAQPCSGTPAVATISGSPTYACAAFVATLTATSAPVGCGISYQWQSSADGFTYANIVGATGLTAVVNVSANTYYQLVVSCAYSGTSSTSSNIELQINPITALGPITGGFSPMCTGMTLSLASTTTGGTWSVTNGNATITTLGYLTGIAAGTDTVVYAVTEACETIYDSFVVAIEQMEVPSVTFNAFPGATVCPGDSVTVSGIENNGGTAPTIQWAVNGVNFGALNQDTIKFLPTNGEIVTCTITSNYYCASPSTAIDTLTIAVDSVIRPGISTADGGYGDSVCLGVPITFTAVDTNGGAVPSNTWYVNGTLAGSGTSFTYAPSNGDTVYCMLISSFICAVPDTVYSPIRQMSVYSVETPAVTIFENGGDTSCSLYNTTFTANPIFGGLSPFIRWSVNRVNVATGPTYTYLPSTGDSVYCMLATSSTCASTDTVFSNAIRTTVSSLVAPTLSITCTESDTIVSGTYDTLIASGAYGGGSPVYSWYVNGVLVPGVTGSMYVTDSIANSDFVQCFVASSYPCADPNTAASNEIIFTVINAGVKTVGNGGLNISVVPNPNSGAFVVKAFIGNDNSGATISISDVLGQVVYTTYAAAQNGNLRQNINLNGELAAGTYLLHLTTGNTTQVVKITIDK